MMATKHLNRKEDGDNGKYETPNPPPAENPSGFSNRTYVFEGGIEEEKDIAAKQKGRVGK
ncbi:hypothetical protein A3E04_00875 [Candidatus Kuenenbacteria bacterium RIFCSPHIGHO2_12_FULL_42_14]|uniref:Uncharacterized protein n=1 Tax=Candidatus Kuenenbacteria bacterium RIFCSPHIGHO2_12_FULL_42_14 TaxID=1798563 RepID=A0A1F6GKV9_9BACT|nr:MAG: hypothetical protein A3E04_00875 [Candidatus Kuenenbacteria bacterium RIFCSPHIGHO2_12_FULL_42_14]